MDRSLIESLKTSNFDEVCTDSSTIYFATYFDANQSFETPSIDRSVSLLRKSRYTMEFFEALMQFVEEPDEKVTDSPISDSSTYFEANQSLIGVPNTLEEVVEQQSNEFISTLDSPDNSFPVVGQEVNPQPNLTSNNEKKPRIISDQASFQDDKDFLERINTIMSHNNFINYSVTNFEPNVPHRAADEDVLQNVPSKMRALLRDDQRMKSDLQTRDDGDQEKICSAEHWKELFSEGSKVQRGYFEAWIELMVATRMDRLMKQFESKCSLHDREDFLTSEMKQVDDYDTKLFEVAMKRRRNIREYEKVERYLEGKEKDDNYIKEIVKHQARSDICCFMSVDDVDNTAGNGNTDGVDTPTGNRANAGILIQDNVPQNVLKDGNQESDIDKMVSDLKKIKKTAQDSKLQYQGQLEEKNAALSDAIAKLKEKDAELSAAKALLKEKDAELADARYQIAELSHAKSQALNLTAENSTARTKLEEKSAALTNAEANLARAMKDDRKNKRKIVIKDRYISGLVNACHQKWQKYQSELEGVSEDETTEDSRPPRKRPTRSNPEELIED